MNERIRELVEQAGIALYKKDVLDKHFPELYDGVYCESSVEQLEKFAELIVLECMRMCEVAEMSFVTHGCDVEASGAITVKQFIAEHFGVE